MNWVRCNLKYNSMRYDGRLCHLTCLMSPGAAWWRLLHEVRKVWPLRVSSCCAFIEESTIKSTCAILKTTGCRNNNLNSVASCAISRIVAKYSAVKKTEQRREPKCEVTQPVRYSHKLNAKDSEILEWSAGKNIKYNLNELRPANPPT